MPLFWKQTNKQTNKQKKSLEQCLIFVRDLLLAAVVIVMELVVLLVLYPCQHFMWTCTLYMINKHL